jgi:hypothetical protein
MYFGLSKNLGGGFRIGVGSKIGGGSSSSPRQPSSRDLKNEEHRLFMQKVKEESENALKIFLAANGQDFNKLYESDIDLDDLFKDNPKYIEFIDLYKKLATTIEKVNFSGDGSISAKRTITDDLFKVKEFIQTNYPKVQLPASSHSPVKKPAVKFWLVIGILFMPYFFSWVTLKKGYSRNVRIAAFIWMIIVFGIIVSNKNNSSSNATTHKQTIESTIPQKDVPVKTK